MSWSKEVRAEKYRQTDCCEECGGKIDKTIPSKRPVLHHRKNKSLGGKDNIDNCVLRHSHCEEICHEIHPTGNPTRIEFLLYLRDHHDTTHLRSMEVPSLRPRSRSSQSNSGQGWWTPDHICSIKSRLRKLPRRIHFRNASNDSSLPKGQGES